MRINKSIMAVLSLALILSLIVLLAFAAPVQPKPKSRIGIEEAKSCKAVFYDESIPIIQDCTYYNNYTACLNNSGPSTNCLQKQDKINFKCRKGEFHSRKNSTECKTLSKFTVSIDDADSSRKNEIDFSEWGVCINTTENDCLAITCGTLAGGSARNGVFNGCDGGKSCQKFLFCTDGTRKVLYKASRGDFVQEDPTFKLNPLAVKEVGP